MVYFLFSLIKNSLISLQTKSTLSLLKTNGGFILITLLNGPSVLKRIPFNLRLLISLVANFASGNKKSPLQNQNYKRKLCHHQMVKLQ